MPIFKNKSAYTSQSQGGVNKVALACFGVSIVALLLIFVIGRGGKSPAAKASTTLDNITLKNLSIDVPIDFELVSNANGISKFASKSDANDIAKGQITTKIFLANNANSIDIIGLSSTSSLKSKSGKTSELIDLESSSTKKAAKARIKDLTTNVYSDRYYIPLANYIWQLDISSSSEGSKLFDQSLDIARSLREL